jgi:DNA-binding response OmpR family regulator
MVCIAAIDVDMATLDLYAQVLADAGHDALLCPGPATAYECVRAAAPAAIILDLHLSTDDASWAVLQQLKTDAQLSETPVLVCTADPRVVQRCAKDLEGLGCALLAKPFDIDVLMAVLRQRIEDSTPTHPALEAKRRLAELQQRTDQHLQHARALAMQVEERLAEARRVLADGYRLQQREPGGAP